MKSSAEWLEISNFKKEWLAQAAASADFNRSRLSSAQLKGKRG
jgi:hypothetical protein